MNFYFLIGQKLALNQRSGMILEVQIQNFGARAPEHKRATVFIFKKFQGAQILIYIWKNWHKASFYIFLVLKTIFFTLKKRVFGFWRKTPPKIVFPQNSAFLSFETATLKKLFFIFSYWLSFKNNRHTNVVLVIIFENALKKLLTTKSGQN